MHLKHFLQKSASNLIFLLGLILGLLFSDFSVAQSVTYNTGSGNFTVPDGVTRINVSVWGAGGGGGYVNSNQGAAGGGGGAFILANNYTVVPGGTIPYTVGAGGRGQTDVPTASTSGTPSIFGPTGPTQLFANGGGRASNNIPGSGGFAGAGIYIYRAGGSSAAASTSPNTSGSGGGAAGSSTGTGAAGVSSGAGGVGNNGAGSGGNGGFSALNTSDLGQNGSQPGGGGGGEGRQGRAGGNGGDGRIVITWTCSNTLTSAPSTANQSVCAGTGITPINYTIVGAYSATVSGLPPGVTPSYLNGIVTISGTPTGAAAGNTYTYTVSPTGSCTSGIATGTIVVPPNMSAGTITSNTFCQGSPFPAGVTQATSNATGISNPGVPGANGLPAGVSAAWSGNMITFSGTPIIPGVYSYSIPLTGGCGSVNATGTITVNESPAIKSFTAPGETKCINVAFNQVSVGTGFGYTYQWYSNDTKDYVTPNLISGATTNTYLPSSSAVGTTYYYVVVSSPTCSSVTSPVSEAYIVMPNNTAGTISSNTFCQGSALPAGVSQATTGATGIGAATGLPPGLSVTWAANQIRFTGTPTSFGTFNYTIPLTGGCGSVSATGTITINAAPVVNTTSSFTTQSRCINTSAFNPLTVEARLGFSYQWYSNTTGSTSSGTQTPVGTNSNSFTPPNNVAGTRYYYVIISSTSCSATATGPQSGAIIVNPSAIVSFTGQPTGPTACANTDVTYSTQTGQTGYTWTIPGVLNTDYTITSGGNGSSNLVIKWLTIGSKSVTVNYQDFQGCGATSPATSSTITVQANSAVPVVSTALTSVCINTILPLTTTHNTTAATGIGTPTGLPAGIVASWSANTIRLSSNGVAVTAAPGIYSYSIPLTGGCGSVTATGTLEITPIYDITSIFSESATIVGGAATITFNGDPLKMLNGTYEVVYQIKQGAGAFTMVGPVNATVVNGKGTFTTTPINSISDTYTVRILSIKKSTDACTVTLPIPPTTYFGVCSAVFNANSTFYVPANVYSITIEIYAGGGGGDNAGGGGGAYSIRQNIPVTPGEPLAVRFLSGGSSGQDGGAVYVTKDSNIANQLANSLLYANGGKGSISSGIAAGGTFDPRYSGSNGNPSSGNNGGKGGGPVGGLGGTSGNNGISPGGGGGSTRIGGAGLVLISYTCPDSDPTDCINIIDDGSKSGTTLIQFTCSMTWNVPEGLTRFSATLGSGGGGGGFGVGAGGGGAGELVQNLTYSTSNPNGLPAGTSFNITVGQGGVGSTSLNNKGGVGGMSSITGMIDGVAFSASAAGGGGGGSGNNGNGMNGASGGGGAARNLPDTSFPGGTKTTSQGNNGSDGDASGNGAISGGGGGGHDGKGTDGQSAGFGQGKGGDGGNGRVYTIAGSTRLYGAGGGGIGNTFNGVNKFNGVGGSANNVKIGGDGNQDNATSIGFPGQEFTGSGGGAGFGSGGRGGSGILFISYENLRILPVEFLYFEANLDESNRTADLSWTTAKEWESSHFEIERSVNGVSNWNKIGELEAQGYSEVPSEYNYSDPKLPASGGIVYYRLKQVDFNGKFSYSITKSIKIEALKGSGAWVAYPNPSSKKSMVNLDLIDSSVYSDQPIIIRISDMKGVSETFTVNQIESVSQVVNGYLDRSISGMYVLQLIWGNNSQQIKLLRN